LTLGMTPWFSQGDAQEHRCKYNRRDAGSDQSVPDAVDLDEMKRARLIWTVERRLFHLEGYECILIPLAKHDPWETDQ
jgi:hypothetical protein